MTRAAVVLAAGQGTRFRSDLAKVLHPIAGWSMVRWVLQALRPLELDRVVVVVGHQHEQVTAAAQAVPDLHVVTVHQAEQRGTGHAMRVAVSTRCWSCPVTHR
jgi:bifunctional UDP-N-acetylglucosamine pyrophosphorylase / glucosamine-1-phosphate N-acetyltransferase